MDEVTQEKIDELKKESEEVLKAKAGVELKKESPLEEVRRLNKETKDMISQLSDAEKRIEKMAAELTLSGRTEAGGLPKVEKSPLEAARSKGKDFVNKWYSK